MPRERTTLTAEQLERWLAGHPGWSVGAGMLRRTFVFPDFRASMSFVDRIADAAEDADHHPDIDIRYAKVTLGLVTHDAGGLTARDTALAEAADALLT